MHKKKARESIAIETPDFLRMKHAKMGLFLSSYFEHCPFKNTTPSQALSWWSRESTPIKKHFFFVI